MTDPSGRNCCKDFVAAAEHLQGCRLRKGGKDGPGHPAYEGVETLKPPALLPQQQLPLHRSSPTEPFPPTLLSLLHGSGSAVSFPPYMSSQNTPLPRSFPAEPYPPALAGPHQPPSPASQQCIIPMTQFPPLLSPALLQWSGSAVPFLPSLPSQIPPWPAASSLHFPCPPSPLRRTALIFTQALLLHPCEGLLFSSPIPPALKDLLLCICEPACSWPRLQWSLSEAELQRLRGAWGEEWASSSSLGREKQRTPGYRAYVLQPSRLQPG